MNSTNRIHQILKVLEKIADKLLSDPQNTSVEQSKLPVSSLHPDIIIDNLVNPVSPTDTEKMPQIMPNVVVYHESASHESNRKKKCQNKYRAYTLEFKQKIVEEVRRQFEISQMSLYSIFRAKSVKYGLHLKNITRWYNMKEIKRREGGRKPAYPEIEEKLAQYIKNNPHAKRKEVIQQAQIHMKMLNIPQSKQIRFSKGWYERFRMRMQRKEVEQLKETQPQISKSSASKVVNIILVNPQEETSENKKVSSC